MTVMKFGGRSLSTEARLKQVISRIREAHSPGGQCIVVVSAMGDTTDDLLRAAQAAANGKIDDARGMTSRVFQTMERVIEPFLDARRAHSTETVLEYSRQLESLLYGLWLTRDPTPRIIDAIVGYGECLTAWLLEAVLRSQGLTACMLDTRELIVTDDKFGEANVVWPATEAKVKAALAEHPSTPILVATGFIAATAEGVPTTIGRNGSDFTASILGSILDAEAIMIFTHVDGIMTADPFIVGEAYPLAELSYEEAIDLAYFGAEVLHPKTMIPAMQRGIPIHIRNTEQAEARGTIVHETPADAVGRVKTVTSIEHLSLLYLEWNLIQPRAYYLDRALNVLQRHTIRPWLLNVAPQSQNICFAVHVSKASQIEAELRDEFESELAKGWLKPVRVMPQVALVSIVGDGIAQRTEISRQLFRAVDKTRTEILAISQGLSDRMISLIVPSDALNQVVQSIHTSFHLSRRVVNLVQYGKGLVGSTLIQLVREYNQTYANDMMAPRIRYVGISGRDRHALKSDGLEIGQELDWGKLLTESGRLAAADLIAWVQAQHLSNIIVIDETASDDMNTDYEAFIEAGFHIVSSNKKPFTIAQDRVDKLLRTAEARSLGVRYETTVGAGLPIINAVQSLIQTGDTVTSIQGILSGSVNAILSMMEDGLSLSEAISEARSRGFTEPHPAEDLSGRDVARKALILARELGMTVAIEDIDLSPMVPDSLTAIPDPDQFVAQSVELDDEFRHRFQSLQRNEKTLRYVAFISNHSLKVGLTELPKSDPMAQLRGSDNIIIVRSQWYDDNPLMVRGPGAGAKVTAGGAFSDILQIAARLP